MSDPLLNRTVLPINFLLTRDSPMRFKPMTDDARVLSPTCVRRLHTELLTINRLLACHVLTDTELRWAYGRKSEIVKRLEGGTLSDA